MWHGRRWTVRTCLVLVLTSSTFAAGTKYLSHPPVRPVPAPKVRPVAQGPTYFVDAARGDDAGPGTKEKPWRTVMHAFERLGPGDTLYLRGGVYFERLYCGIEGKPDAWIVAPTNRRRYGFDWQDWGRLDALEALDWMSTPEIDPDRIYLTGHSMGGHGTWYLGALYAHRFAAIAPSPHA